MEKRAHLNSFAALWISKSGAAGFYFKFQLESTTACVRGLDKTCLSIWKSSGAKCFTWFL